MILIDEQFIIEHPHILQDNEKRLQEIQRTFSPVLAGTPQNRRGVFRLPNKKTPDSPSSSRIIAPRTSPRIRFDDNIYPHHDGNTESSREITRDTNVDISPATSTVIQRDSTTISDSSPGRSQRTRK